MRQNDLLVSSVSSALMKFTFPILCALLLQTLYGSVDMLIVGNFSDVANVSAVSTGSQFMMIVTSLCTGLAMGTTILLSSKMGEGKQEEVKSIVFHAICLFTCIAIVLSVICLCQMDRIIAFMNTPKDAHVQTYNYMFYSFSGILMVFLYNVLGSVFRALGDARTPLIAVGIACVFNILFDLLLVGGLHMGAQGAAIATISAQGLSVLICGVRILRSEEGILRLHKKDCVYKGRYIKQMLVLGFPIALQSVLVNFSFLFITMMINQYGIVYSAAVGVCEKVCGIIMLVPMAFMQSLSVFVAQNIGAKQMKRVNQGLRFTLMISFLFCLLMAYVSCFHGAYLLRLFTSDAQVIAQASEYLKAYAFDTLLVAFTFCFSGYFSGAGKTLFVMIQGIVGSLFFRIVFTLYFVSMTPFSLFRVGLAIPIASMVQIIMCVIYYIYQRRSKQ